LERWFLAHADDATGSGLRQCSLRRIERPRDAYTDSLRGSRDQGRYFRLRPLCARTRRPWPSAPCRLTTRTR